MSRLWWKFYACLTMRGDALFELIDAQLCTDGPVRALVDLAFAHEHRRGHRALDTRLNQSRVAVARLRRAMAGLCCRCPERQTAGLSWPWLLVCGLCGRRWRGTDRQGQCWNGQHGENEGGVGESVLPGGVGVPDKHDLLGDLPGQVIVIENPTPPLSIMDHAVVYPFSVDGSVRQGFFPSRDEE
ncbi:transposase [Streptomyces sp. NBC_01446]|uniref:Transposase n=1 Tax=Streptomyces sp. NBC_00119 TaxID=2975659 RepID=A0AAU1UL46_9ACTN|nr:transposase [Streptomyces sp. NBC_01446]MCX5321094.1 transposase [Streptomyces sp. NBC_00120]